MPGKVRYSDRKDAIRAALLTCAEGGSTISYETLGELVGVPRQGPWMPVMDLISREERGAGRPDITHLVFNKRTGTPGSIEYKPAKKPTDAQRVRLRELREECWAFHRTS